SDGPFGEIAGVDELNRIGWRTGRENFAAAINSHRPIREAISLVARADDKPRANDQRFSGKPLLGFFFGERFERSIGFVTRRFHRLECLLVGIGAFAFFCRRDLVWAGLYVTITRNRRDEDVTLDVAFENLRRVAHPCRKSCRIIDDNVPLSILQRVELAVAITDELLDFARQFTGMRFAAVERRHLVSPTEGVLHLIWAGESRAAENQDAHRFHRFLSGKRCRSRHDRKRGASASSEFDKLATRHFHMPSSFLVIPSQVEESLAACP